MHEFSIAACAVDRIIEAARNKGAKRIHEVEILVGELSLVGEGQLIFWIKEILSSKGEIAQDVKIDLKQIPAIIKCIECGYQGNLKPKNEDHFYPTFRCPNCNSENIQIEKGRDCVLNKIQIEM
jgi:hydrogenase nickel incorporation protein HypA/HybF